MTCRKNANGHANITLSKSSGLSAGLNRRTLEEPKGRSALWNIDR
jgi:hypothetical protein